MSIVGPGYWEAVGLSSAIDLDVAAVTAARRRWTMIVRGTYQSQGVRIDGLSEEPDGLILAESVPYLSVVAGVLSRILAIYNEMQEPEDEWKNTWKGVQAVYALVSRYREKEFDSASGIIPPHIKDAFKTLEEAMLSILHALVNYQNTGKAARLLRRRRLKETAMNCGKDIWHALQIFEAALQVKMAIQLNEIHGAIMPGITGAKDANLSALMCATPSAHFTGRAGLLDGLSSAFTTPGRQVVTIIGKGGAGKTQLALKLAEVHHDKFAHILFSDASSTESLRASFKKLADANGIADNVADILAFLAQLKAELLLVFDNADDPEVDLGPFIPRSTNVKVVITSRNMEVITHASSSQYACEMPDLDLDEAVDLLLSRAGVQRMDDTLMDAQDLAQAVGCLALAVAAAGAYIASSRCTIQKYSQLLSEHRRDILSRRGRQALDGYYQDTVFSTFELSYSRLGPLAQEFLRICSFYHFSNIPCLVFERAATYAADEHPLVLPGEVLLVPTMVEDTQAFLRNFVTTTGSWNSLQLQDIIQEILSVSLISCLGPFLSLHPLIHQCIQDIIRDKAGLRAVALQILALSAPSSYTREEYVFAQQLLPHVNHAFYPDIRSAFVSGRFSDVWNFMGSYSKALASKEQQSGFISTYLVQIIHRLLPYRIS
ncbi:hypothetical protein CYLTODRAFT_458696 [Cylindrobasidium torrendii FP15055 ss-10]|uniref:NB-ARC domain-containing protein n=1 Tax=Cylindrobasidium torrendii FP15055 ss-10 TaxID=1314674 RepID=A0A0D7AXT2_9AGAR|nr:hypothetical protein CYLTODRAFT_458696 [Cylindrobasidium torrendii FP15055 ss-10]